MFTLIAFYAYCSGEATCFLWTSSYFAGTKQGMTDGLIAAFGSLIFGGLMLGRLIAGFVSNKLGDKRLIRIGAAVELLGIILVLIPFRGYIMAAIGFVIIGTGMGPIYPAIQHMAPYNFGKKFLTVGCEAMLYHLYSPAMLQDKVSRPACDSRLVC